MKNIVFLIALTFPAAPVLAATCFTHTTHLTAEEAVSSPFGVMRRSGNGPGAASAGWHMGLDIVNSARERGPIYSAMDGKVSEARGSTNFTTVESDDMKVNYLHMFTPNRRVRQVSAGDQIGRMGSAGASATHLHVETQIRGDALQTAGGNSRAFSRRDKFGHSPLTASAIRAAAPRAWFYVNPEPFLVNRIPYQGGVGRKYQDQLGEVRIQTLPRTCSPSQTPLAPGRSPPAEDPKIIATTTETGDARSVVQDIAVDRSNSEQGAATMAGQSRHGLLVDLAKVIAAENLQNSAAADLENQARMEIALAHLLALKSERIGGEVK
ncbi:M23 family metallopeptidase [Castellaniella sp.]|uniref:M23 family metallopeptidase n=1 Tax=Castellaniella sp. TaxID=1955812 RepID=UPI002AFF6845|nr:M23 family metallopeptidase [Castellaniella sp.]